MNKKNIIVYIVDISIELNKNCFLFKNNVKYAEVKFMPSKMSKRLISMFFNNFNLVLIEQHLSYKNIDKIRELLIKLIYSKVIWQTKSLSICLLITNITPKKYFIYIPLIWHEYDS